MEKKEPNAAILTEHNKHHKILMIAILRNLSKAIVRPISNKPSRKL